MRVLTPLPDTVGSHIRVLRLTRGLSQAQLARRVGLSLTLVSRIERDERELTPPELKRILAALGVSGARQDATTERKAGA